MTSLPVRAEDARPAGKPGECFYCNQPIGKHHGPECVLMVRSVYYVVHADGDFVGLWEHGEPAFWNVEQCLFHKHGSTWCADNAATEGRWRYGKPVFQKFVDAIQPACLCGLAKFTLVRADAKVRYAAD